MKRISMFIAVLGVTLIGCDSLTDSNGNKPPSVVEPPSVVDPLVPEEQESRELVVTPESTTVPVGLDSTINLQLLTSGNEDVLAKSESVLWTSSDETIAVVDQDGKVFAKSSGKVTISVSVMKAGKLYSKNINLTIIAPVITQLSVTSDTAQIMVDVPVELQVQATFSNGSVVDFTTNSELDWSVDNAELAEVEQSEDKILITGKKEGTVNVTVSADSMPKPVTALSAFKVIQNYGIEVAENGVSSLSRSVFEGYDIDDIKLKQDSTTRFELLNSTPRYLNNPLIRLNNTYFRINLFVEPFQVVSFDLPHWFDEEIITAQFVEEQPLFKTDIIAYANSRPNDSAYAEPTEHNVYQYEKEIRGLKQLMNSYDYNQDFIGFIESYDKSRSLLRHRHDQWCNFDHSATTLSVRSIESSSDDTVGFKANDTSSNTIKHVSMIAAKPRSHHMMLTRSGYGVASLGNGWVSVRDFRLFTEGETAPKSTFLHEKMHNHGFNHSGGMTYGYPDKIRDYVHQNWADFYNDGKVEASISTLAATYSLKEQGDQFKIEISFIDKSAGNDASKRTIDKFMLLTTSLGDLKESFFIDERAKSTPILPERVAEDKGTYSFDNITVTPLTINEANDGQSSSKLVFVFDKPEQASVDGIPVSLIFIGGSKEDSTQQSNLVVQYSGSGGFISDDGNYVYLYKSKGMDDDGIFTSQVNSYTPQQAEEICQDRGLTLGVLKPFRSREMIDFQTKYLKYGSQVGLSYETGKPVAIIVPTTVSLSHILEVDKGQVIVCSAGTP